MEPQPTFKLSEPCSPAEGSGLQSPSLRSGHHVPFPLSFPPAVDKRPALAESSPAGSSSHTADLSMAAGEPPENAVCAGEDSLTGSGSVQRGWYILTSIHPVFQFRVLEPMGAVLGPALSV